MTMTTTTAVIRVNHSTALLLLWIYCMVLIFPGFMLQQCDLLHENQRFDCYPLSSVTQARCLAIGCCWKTSQSMKNAPYCYYPINYASYKATQAWHQKTSTVVIVEKNSSKHLLWPNEINKLRVELISETQNRARIRIIDYNSQRWDPEIYLHLHRNESASGGQSGQDSSEGKGNACRSTLNTNHYAIEYTNDPFTIKVIRQVDHKIVFDSAIATAPLIYTDQFLQISTIVNSDHIYGLGQHRNNFQWSFNQWKSIGFWNRDQPPTENTNLYGTHNVFLSVDSNGSAYGIFFLNSNAQEVILQPGNYITYRTVGGILDFSIFTGPSVQDVYQQIWNLLGSPPLPPYWSMGFHLSRYGYKSINDFTNVIDRNIKLSIPFDTIWLDIDYMDAYKDWTVNNVSFHGLNKYIIKTKDLHGKRLVVIVDAGIPNATHYRPYSEGRELGIFVNMSESSAPLIGQVWPGTTAFPDFSNPLTIDYWSRSIARFQELLDFDGLWTDMNEPSNFVSGSIDGCTSNRWDQPPYTPTSIVGGSLSDKTICPSAVHHGSYLHYDLHNIYGYLESKVSYSALTMLQSNRRVFLLTRSSFPGSGQYTYSWSGDNLSSWEDLYHSLIHILNFNLFGIPMTGADVCGFRGNATPELCIRWTQAAVLYPFLRNHNTIGSSAQDPAAWDATTQHHLKEALHLRYEFIPYLYTLMADAYFQHLPVWRPLIYHFSNASEELHKIDWQFMVGSSLMVAPVLLQGTEKIDVYFPQSAWCDLTARQWAFYPESKISIPVTMASMPMYIRGGSVIYLQGETSNQNATNTKDYQRLPLSVHACLHRENGQAHGRIYWDDGWSLNYTNGLYNVANFSVDVTAGSFISDVVQRKSTKNNLKVSRIHIYGLSREPQLVQLDGYGKLYTIFEGNVLSINLDPVQPSLRQFWRVSWRF